jgi:hypothetical protein
LVCVEVVLRPRAITLDWRAISGVVRRLLLTVEQLRVEAESEVMEPEPAWRVEPTRVEKPNEPLTFRVEAVTVEAVALRRAISFV